MLCFSRRWASGSFFHEDGNQLSPKEKQDLENFKQTLESLIGLQSRIKLLEKEIHETKGHGDQTGLIAELDTLETQVQEGLQKLQTDCWNKIYQNSPLTSLYKKLELDVPGNLQAALGTVNQALGKQ